MSQSRTDIIQEAAKTILDQWRHWDVDAEYACQMAQSMERYEPMMLAKLVEVIESAMKAEDWRAGT
jgi:hypothetical protein